MTTRRNILITGASSGLGKGMAIEFAKQGCNLALCARRFENLEKLKEELLSINPNIDVSPAFVAAYTVMARLNPRTALIDEIVTR